MKKMVLSEHQQKLLLDCFETLSGLAVTPTIRVLKQAQQRASLKTSIFSLVLALCFIGGLVQTAVIVKYIFS